MVLYIPIWLYSNSDTAFQGIFESILYIPIWLYSNQNQTPNGNCPYTFTFQSGYIQMGAVEPVDRFKPSFTFQSGYIQIGVVKDEEGNVEILYIPIWLYSNFTVKNSLIVGTKLYIPIWLYSNPYPIIPSIQAILNYIFCLPIYLQVQNDYLVYSLLLLIILLPLFYNNCRTLYIL